jgi:hypothetical protein
MGSSWSDCRCCRLQVFWLAVVSQVSDSQRAAIPSAHAVGAGKSARGLQRSCWTPTRAPQLHATGKQRVARALRRGRGQAARPNLAALENAVIDDDLRGSLATLQDVVQDELAVLRRMPAKRRDLPAMGESPR